METDGYMEEQLNIRCFYLRLLKRVWVLPLAACAGALCAYLLYGAVTRVSRPLLYEAKTQLYLHFVENATDDRVYDHYNAYTWNDLIRTDGVREKMNDPAVCARAEEDFSHQVPDSAQYSDRTAEWGAQYLSGAMSGDADGDVIRAVLPSDLRVMWITATTKEAAQSAYLSALMSRALEAWADENEALREIEITRLAEVSPVSYPERAAVAAVTGAVSGCVCAALALLVLHLLDDAVYVPEDAEKRYGLPVVAIREKEGQKEAALPELLRRESDAYFQKLEEGGKRWALLARDAEEEAREAADVLLLQVESGRRNGTLTAHLLSQARARGECVDGILFSNADAAFLKRYYRL